MMAQKEAPATIELTRSNLILDALKFSNAPKGTEIFQAQPKVPYRVRAPHEMRDRTTGDFILLQPGDEIQLIKVEGTMAHFEVRRQRH